MSLFNLLPYGEVTGNVVPNGPGQFRPEADIVMLRKGVCSGRG